MKRVARNIVRTARDVRIIRLGARRLLVVSCDSSGAIGSKALDKVKCPPQVVGRFAARVALMEALATGAKPICVVAPLAVEPTPTGREILRGIRYEMKYAGLSPHIPIVDSTEKNFRTKETGVGVAVVALANASSLKVGYCCPEDEIYILGTPCVGREVLQAEGQHTIADPRDVNLLLKYGSIHEVIPVGSKGIIHEANVLALDSNLRFRPDRLMHELRKSAGPGTVLLFAGRGVQQVLARVRKPVTSVGSLTS